MAFEDLKQYFDRIHTCKYVDDFVSSSTNFYCLDDDNLPYYNRLEHDFVYRMNVPKSGHYTLSFCQKDKKGESSTYEYCNVRFLMFEGKSSLSYIKGTTGFKQRDTHIEMDLKASQDYYAYMNPEDITVPVGDLIANFIVYGPSKAKLAECAPGRDKYLDRTQGMVKKASEAKYLQFIFAKTLSEQYQVESPAKGIKKCLIEEPQLGFTFIYIDNQSEDHYAETVRYKQDGIKVCFKDGNSYNDFGGWRGEMRVEYMLDDDKYDVNIEPGKKFCVVYAVNIGSNLI